MKIDPQIHLFIHSSKDYKAKAMVKVDKTKFLYSDAGNSAREDKFKEEMTHYFRDAGIITNYAVNLSIITLELNQAEAKELLLLHKVKGIKFYL